MTDISVIVPFHGAEPYLEQCVDALLGQRFPTQQREIIFVDNGGTAKARAVIERHRTLRLLREKGRGAYMARNAGLRAAHGEIIAFTDADCAAAPDWLDSIASAMENPGVNVVLGSYLPACRSFAASTLATYENEKNRFIFSGTDDSLYYGYTNNMAVRSKMFQEIGPFLPRLRGSDAVFARAVVKQFGRDAICFVPSMAVQHLEIRGTLDYYRKVFVHSRSSSALRSVTPLRPLSPRQRLQVFIQTVKAQRQSPMGAATTFLLLAGGMAVWTLGSVFRGRDAEPKGPAGERPIVSMAASTENPTASTAEVTQEDAADTSSTNA